MDVLAKFKKNFGNTISNTVYNTAYGISQLSSVLPGNPVTREFEVTAHVASAGPNLLWKVYNGYKKSTKQQAAIFVFEKRLLERWSNKTERELILDALKRGVLQLTKLRHPQVLTVQHPLEESRDSLAFATEPIFASLSNIMGQLDNLPQPIPTNLTNHELFDIEIRHGLLQLSEGLAFLHSDVKLLHRNVCPESVVINTQGAWKIFGFDFCVLNQSVDSKQPVWAHMEYDPTTSSVLQPRLDYQAPECILASTASPLSDIFSLGMLIYALHSKNKLPMNESLNDFNKCKHFLQSLKGSNITSKLLPLPESLRDSVKLMLHYSPEVRPQAHQFIQIDYFKDIGVTTLNYLDKMFQWDNLQKSKFYKSLPEILKKLPHRVVIHRVLPSLYKELVNSQMIPFVLPSILQVMESCEVEEFRNHILPNIKSTFSLEEPPQVSLILIQNMNLLLKLCPIDVIKNDIVHILTRALESEWEQLQELCLIALPSLVTIIDGPTIKNSVLPKLRNLCLRKNKNFDASLGIRVNCLLCLAKMIPHFDRWMVFDEVLPFLQEIPHAGQPAILMAVIGIYRLLLNHEKFNISKELLATKILPVLLPLCIEQNLSSTQFETLASLVIEMVNRVTNEHREAIRQLDAMRRETQQFNASITQNPPSTGDKTNIFDNNQDTKLFNVEKELGIQDKHRFAQQQEIHQRLQSQSPLQPQVLAAPRVQPQPKDLTETLVNSNLNQLKLSSSKSMPQCSNYSINSGALSWQSSNLIQQNNSPFQMPPNQIRNERVPSIDWQSTTPMWNPPFSAQNWSNPTMSSTKSDNALNTNNNDAFMRSSQTPTNVQPKPNLSTQDIIDFLS